MNTYPNLYITQDDMDWLDLNYWKPPSYNLQKGYILTKEQELVFKEESLSSGVGRTLKLENRFTGKIGEALVKRLYPQFIFNIEKYALFDCSLKGHKFDVKTCTAVNLNFQDDWNIAVPRHWIDNRDYEAIIFCHYNLEKRRIVVLGWQWKKILIEPDRLIVRKKGEDCHNKWDKFMFTALQDTYMWGSDALRNMSNLPT